MIRRLRRDESGSTALEVAIIFPAALLLITMTVQVALWQHASHVASASAQEAGRVARSSVGTSELARGRAMQALSSWGPSAVLDPEVDVTEDAGTATVTVRGVAPRVVPGVRLAVVATSGGPLETFRPDLGSS